ncbi:hypothetical protein BDL97_02G006600 [Sphagnum fallax]|nr:hypothetical protein BDL97_02G006600 [Sphagnum fallax]
MDLGLHLGGGQGGGSAAMPTAAAAAAGDQTTWVDASGFFFSVCAELDVGELIHGEHFNLFEAMSALEIMDPKMDAGMATTKYKTADEAIESGAAPINLSVHQLVDVMDHLLACEATWHKGHPLAQTVFSCLYLLKLERTTPNSLLHAFCTSVRATCSLVRTTVALADIHEEEDFVTIAYGLPVEGEGDAKCLSLLSSVEETILRQLRFTKGTASGKRKGGQDAECLQDDPALEEGYCQAILCRLRFRKAFFRTLSYMEKPQGRGLEMARKHIAAALSELRDIRLSSAFLDPSSNVDLAKTQNQNLSSDTNSRDSGLVKEKPSTASGRPAVGFDESVNRRLLAPTPPRSIKILCWEDALKYFEQLFEDLDQICSLPLSLGLEELLQFLVDFQQSQPDLFARAQLQLLILQDDKLLGQEPMAGALYKVLGMPANGINNNQQTQTFVTQASRLMQHLLKVMCTNTAWQRRKLGRVILDWANLLQESWWTDNVIMAWAAEQTCWIVTHFLMLGFQLDLYAPSEYCMLYWYLDHAFLTLLHYKLAKEKSLFEHQASPLPDSPDSAKKKGKKKKGGTSMKVTGTALKDVKLTSSILLIQCYIDLCKGFIWMLAALTLDCKLVNRTPIFNTEQERFLQRFEILFKVLAPEPMSYFQFKEATCHNHFSIKEQYQKSYDHFVAVQQRIQELGPAPTKAPELSAVSRGQRAIDVRKMEQVALRNRIALQIVHQAGPGDNLRVSFEFSQHPCFPVAVVKKS